MATAKDSVLAEMALWNAEMTQDGPSSSSSVGHPQSGVTYAAASSLWMATLFHGLFYCVFLGVFVNMSIFFWCVFELTLCTIVFNNLFAFNRE